ncbi:Oligoribonuclease [Glycine max]|nr:Oligoribonuclease [Glycine max]
MEKLANSFSVLELDADDSHVPTTAVDELCVRVSHVAVLIDLRISERTHGSSDKRVNADIDIVPGKSEKQNLENPVTSSCEYKLPLVWIDLEMTGLNIEVDRILEIACIITDGNLTKTVETIWDLSFFQYTPSSPEHFLDLGPDLVIHQTKECLDRMGEWCQSHHAASGLTKKVLKSTISEGEAEKQVIEFVKRYVNVGLYTPLLAGSSIYVDFQFLKKYMPKLASLFSHVVVDVSSVKALCIRWYPKDKERAPSKLKTHRALDDIRESIEELRYYKANIFKPRSRK